MVNLTKGEKEKLNTLAELENIKRKYGLKALIEIVRDAIDNQEDVKKVGMELTNWYYEQQEINEAFKGADSHEEYISKVMEIAEKYNNQYPTDKDLEANKKKDVDFLENMREVLGKENLGGSWICFSCGVMHGGRKPSMNTEWQEGDCEICGRRKQVTQVRDYWSSNSGIK